MKIKREIKLKNSKECLGCPCWNGDEEYCCLYGERLENDSEGSPIRLKKCIKDNGK